MSTVSIDPAFLVTDATCPRGTKRAGEIIAPGSQAYRPAILQRLRKAAGTILRAAQAESIEPTSSPRLFVERAPRPSVGDAEAALPAAAPSGARRPRPPTFSAMPRPSGQAGAEEALGASLRDRAVERSHERVSRRPAPRRAPGARASPRRPRRRRRLAAPSRENTSAIALERQRERDDAAAVGRRRASPRGGTPAASATTSRADRLLKRVLGQAVALGRASRCARQTAEHAGVLARAVVAEPASLPPRRTRGRPPSRPPAEQRPNRLELLAAAPR